MASTTPITLNHIEAVTKESRSLIPVILKERLQGLTGLEVDVQLLLPGRFAKIYSTEAAGVTQFWRLPTSQKLDILTATPRIEPSLRYQALRSRLTAEERNIALSNIKNDSQIYNPFGGFNQLPAHATVAGELRAVTELGVYQRSDGQHQATVFKIEGMGDRLWRKRRLTHSEWGGASSYEQGVCEVTLEVRPKIVYVPIP